MQKSVFCTIVICLMLLPAVGTAALDYQFSLRCPGTGEEEAVYSRKADNVYTVSIPGFWDLHALEIRFEGAESLFLGDAEIHSGDIIDLQGRLGQEIRIRNDAGKGMGKIRFLQGDALACVFVNVDAEGLAKAQKDKHVILSEGNIRIVEPDGTVAYDGALTQFKGRGNNTFSSVYRKKPFQFKLAKKADISGMGKGKTWLLLSNYIDLSLLRNQISLDLIREAGLRFAIRGVQADVWLNGNYNGLYLLTQKIQINSSRVDIFDLEEATEKINAAPVSSYSTFKEKGKETELRGYDIPADPEDITGGYIVELDKPYRFRNFSDNGFRTSVKLFFVIKEPTCASRAQVTYISEVFDRAFRAIQAKDGYDPKTGAYYADLIDLKSFALKLLIEDFTKNYDLLAGSQFFYKDLDSVDPRIFAGPCWDYDLSMGDMPAAGTQPEGDFALKVSFGKVNWYKLLYQHEDFQQEVARVYRENFRPALAVLLGEAAPAADGVLRPLEGYRDAIASSAAMNFARWSPKGVKGYYRDSGTTPKTNTNRLFQWIRTRVEFMDSRYGAPAAQ